MKPHDGVIIIPAPLVSRLLSITIFFIYFSAKCPWTLEIVEETAKAQ